MLQEVNAIFQTFGASVVVPIIIFIIALLLRVQPKTAMRFNWFYLDYHRIYASGD